MTYLVGVVLAGVLANYLAEDCERLWTAKRDFES